MAAVGYADSVVMLPKAVKRNLDLTEPSHLQLTGELGGQEYAITNHSRVGQAMRLGTS
ncbi:hypothetical protein GCM10027615_36650 [Plantactinospora veratri]